METMDNCTIVYDNLPYSIKGFTLYHAADDYYTIVLNCRFSMESMRKTFQHERKHIMKGDFTNSRDVSQIEFSRH